MFPHKLIEIIFLDYATATDVTYEFKANGLLVSDEAKKLLRNKGWELVAAEPESSDFEVQGRKRNFARQAVSQTGMINFSFFSPFQASIPEPA